MNGLTQSAKFAQIQLQRDHSLWKNTCSKSTKKTIQTQAPVPLLLL